MPASRAFSHAFVRPPSPSLAECQLLHLPRQPFDFRLAAEQHRAYVRHLGALGIDVTVLPAAPDFPDAVFVEDAILMLDELAILCRPGAASRRGEAALILPFAPPRRPVFEILAPGTLEGGDVLRIGRSLFAGRSSRTNAEGIGQLTKIVRPFSYEVIELAVGDCLHLKTAVTSPAPGVMLANPAWVDVSAFHEYELVSVPVAEPWGANTLPLNGAVLVPATHPATAAMLQSRGLKVERVDVSELQKAEAGLTCLSVPW